VVEGSGTDCRLIECGIIRSPRKGDLAVRLLHIYSDIQAVIERLQPDCMAVEGVFYRENPRTAVVLAHVFYRENPRTAVVLAHARGVALLAGAESGLPVAEYPPAEIKKAVVGTGRATKTQVGFMVQKLLGLAEPPRPSDASDGCAAALCHLIIGTGPLARLREAS
jgi:crossover junction endodeoxyribonuclease RuvC